MRATYFEFKYFPRRCGQIHLRVRGFYIYFRFESTATYASSQHPPPKHTELVIQSALGTQTRRRTPPSDPSHLFHCSKRPSSICLSPPILLRFNNSFLRRRLASFEFEFDQKCRRYSHRPTRLLASLGCTFVLK